MRVEDVALTPTCAGPAERRLPADEARCSAERRVGWLAIAIVVTIAMAGCGGRTGIEKQATAYLHRHGSDLAHDSVRNCAKIADSEWNCEVVNSITGKWVTAAFSYRSNGHVLLSNGDIDSLPRDDG